MFDFSDSPFTVPEAIRKMSHDTWHGLAMPGWSWTGAERLAIAQQARTHRLTGRADAAGLPEAAAEATRVLAAAPATTSRSWIDGIVDALDEPAYVEIVGIVARVVAIDTFTRLVGCEPQPFAQPVAGDPEPVVAPSKARKGKAWVTMAGFPVPPNVLSLVPGEQAATNATAEALYMTGPQMEDPDTTIDGLHRTQIETVATTVSHGNECFY